MPISQNQIVSAIHGIISSVPDTGIVLPYERNTESDSETVNLFRGLNAGVLRGWLIKGAGFTQLREGGSCDITRSIKFIIEGIYPFEDKMFDGISSHVKFMAMVEGVNAAFNAEGNWGLGLDTEGTIEHQLLQATEDFHIERWSGGADSQLVHVATFELLVNISITV